MNVGQVRIGVELLQVECFRRWVVPLDHGQLHALLQLLVHRTLGRSVPHDHNHLPPVGQPDGAVHPLQRFRRRKVLDVKADRRVLNLPVVRNKQLRLNRTKNVNNPNFTQEDSKVVQNGDEPNKKSKNSSPS